MKRCLECFSEYEDTFSVCPHCGSVEDLTPKEPVHLAPGTVLYDRYLLGKAVGSGGFGIVYKAWDLKLETVVAVKEFFVSRLVTRAVGLKELIITQKSQTEFTYRKERFLAEARTMAKFSNHKNIPNVFDFFEENGTAYIVMELLSGIPLNEYQKQQKNGKIDTEFALMIASETGNALRSLHEEKIIHRDVAPDNIFICSGKEIMIKLMDLGAAKLTDSTDEVIDIILKPGYSPPEQYDNSKNIGPWTDIYALGATLYYMITGEKPDESTNRKIEDTVAEPSSFDPEISENLNNSIMKAIAIDRHMRFKSISDFLKAINGEKKVLPLSKEKKQKKIRRAVGITAEIALLGACIAAGINIFSQKFENKKLKPAEISVWFSIENSADEEEAMKAVAKDFTKEFPGIEISLKAIPSEQYAEEIARAASEGNLPTLFESTETDDSILKKCHDLNNVISSEQFSSCLFLDKKKCTKQIPLAIEVPVAFVITNGAESVKYSDDFFKDISDFDYDNIAADQRYTEMCSMNYPDYDFKASNNDFFDNTSNTSAVLMSSTMVLNEFRNTLTHVEKKCVFPDSEKIYCSYTYKWSIGNGSQNEIAASEKLLSWMLGNAYQNTLMISRCSDGQIPVNKTCFKAKTESKNLSPVAEIYQNFCFISEE